MAALEQSEPLHADALHVDEVRLDGLPKTTSFHLHSGDVVLAEFGLRCGKQSISELGRLVPPVAEAVTAVPTHRSVRSARRPGQAPVGTRHLLVLWRTAPGENDAGVDSAAPLEVISSTGETCVASAALDVPRQRGRLVLELRLDNGSRPRETIGSPIIGIPIARWDVLID